MNSVNNGTKLYLKLKPQNGEDVGNPREFSETFDSNFANTKNDEISIILKTDRLNL
jgi:hypothetical protein